jgi:uncharacterized protein
MHKVTVEHNPAFAKLEQMAVYEWPIIKRKIGQLDWRYTQQTTYYLLEGEAIITIENNETITITAGDLVIFAPDTLCHWDVIAAIEKHYKFG